MKCLEQIMDEEEGCQRELSLFFLFIALVQAFVTSSFFLRTLKIFNPPLLPVLDEQATTKPTTQQYDPRAPLICLSSASAITDFCQKDLVLLKKHGIEEHTLHGVKLELCSNTLCFIYGQILLQCLSWTQN